jgi:hypothetical protein
VIRYLSAALLALAAAGPAAAAPVTERVESGTVAAELTYDRDGDRYSGFHLTISRDGKAFHDEDLSTGCRKGDPCGVVPANSGAGADSVRIRDLDGDREPEVWVDLFTGGAHCCTVSTFFSFGEGRGQYLAQRHNWRDSGYRLQDLKADESIELRTRDARFGYLYSAYAESYMPVRVLRFEPKRLLDVSRSHRRLLRLDARRALRLYRRVRDREVNVRGILAAYAADRYRLGERRGALRTLGRALRRGDLDRQYPQDFGPFGARYIARLDGFLRKSGYRPPRA